MSSRSNRRPTADPRPPQARTLQSTTGALPVINTLFRRTRLEELLEVGLPKEDRRVRISSSQAILLLMCNSLLSREPIYGLGEWATRHTPAHVGVEGEHSGGLNDDRIGRALDTLFAADVPGLVLSVMTHVVLELRVSLCQLTGRRDFLYVADCKLATSENMACLHQRQGRFITVPPRTRREDAAFGTRIR